MSDLSMCGQDVLGEAPEAWGPSSHLRPTGGLRPSKVRPGTVKMCAVPTGRHGYRLGCGVRVAGGGRARGAFAALRRSPPPHPHPHHIALPPPQRCYDTELPDDDTPSKRTRVSAALGLNLGCSSWITLADPPRAPQERDSLTEDSCLGEEGHVCFGDDGPEAVGPLRRGGGSAAMGPVPTAGGSDGSSDTGVLCCAESDVFTEEECSAEPADDAAASRAPLPITPTQLSCLSLPLAGAAPPAGLPPPPRPQPRDPELADMLR